MKRMLAALILLLGGDCDARESRDDAALVVAIANSPVNLDRRVGADEASQKGHLLLYGTLLRIDDELRVVPRLAESLAPLDPLTYVAHLKRGILFHLELSPIADFTFVEDVRRQPAAGGA